LHSFHKKDELSSTFNDYEKIAKIKEIGNQFSKNNIKLKENIFHKKFPGPDTLRDLIKLRMNRSTLRNQN
jgi:hypothetical protein